MKYFGKPTILLIGKFSIEKRFIEQHYKFISCSYNKEKLVCKGFFKPTNTLYNYKIVYDGITNPLVTIESPQIEYNEDIHIYPNSKSLCLHYPKDEDWTRYHRLFNTIIPWTHEWFIFYELYLITGRWEHEFVPHRKNALTKEPI